MEGFNELASAYHFNATKQKEKTKAIIEEVYDMDWTSYWVQLVLNIPFLFFMYVTYRMGLSKGYKRGARKVLEEWKAVINYVDDTIDVDNTVQGRNQK